MVDENFLTGIFEHNNWANAQIIQACAALSPGQLDAQPRSATMGSIRRTLTHLVEAQVYYLALLTQPAETLDSVQLSFADLQQAARESGVGLLGLAHSEYAQPLPARIQMGAEESVEPWVVMLQAVNHATEHREQIKSMLSALGNTPPEVDGWTYGVVTGAFITSSD